MPILQLPLSLPSELRYIVLFITSVVLVLWQYFGMSTRLDILPNKAEISPPAVHSDNINKGISRTRLLNDDDWISVDCNIILSDTFAFCGVSIPIVASGEQGIDLSRYDEMTIELDYRSDEQDTLLIYMMNEEHTASGARVLKSNLRAVNAETGINRLSLPIQQFYVPSWWLYQNSINDADPEPNLTNVTSLQITTGDNTVARDVHITVSKISLHGKLINADDLYMILLAAWLLTFLVHIINSMRVQSQRIRQSRRQNLELLELNHFLSIQKDQYETMAKHDRLTGAFNRAGARDVLKQVIIESRKAGSSCALLAIDIDHFKQVNDEFGHDVGDKVLKQLTRFIESLTRDRDTFIRWGGEEFMLVCPNTSLESATNLAEALRANIERADLAAETHITCSIGVAALEGDNIKNWFKRADQALYEAKASGRNCVRYATPDKKQRRNMRK